MPACEARSDASLWGQQSSLRNMPSELLKATSDESTKRRGREMACTQFISLDLIYGLSLYWALGIGAERPFHFCTNAKVSGEE